MAAPFSKAVSTDRTMSPWHFLSVRSSKTCLWTSVWTCARRGWGDMRIRTFVHLWVRVQRVMAAAVFQEKTLAVLAGNRCHCGFPTSLFSLHELEDEDMCLHRCHGEEFESCGNAEYFVVYQTQVQGKVWWLTPGSTVTAAHKWTDERHVRKHKHAHWQHSHTVVNQVWKNPVCTRASTQ